MQIDVINGYKAFVELRDDWQRVYETDPESRYFLTWQWLSQLYQRRNEAIFILAARVDKRSQHYVAFFPLRKQIRFSKSARRFTNAICMAGNYWADYTGLICAPEYETSAIPEFSKYLASLHWSKLNLESLSISDCRLELLLTEFRHTSAVSDAESFYSVRDRVLTDNGGDTNLNRCPYIQLDASQDEFLQNKLSSGTRQKIRRFSRKLAADPATSIRCSTAATLDNDLLMFERFWIHMWRQAKGRNTEMLAKKYAGILRQGFASGDMLILVLVRNGCPMGIVSSYIDSIKRTLLFFVSARDEGVNDIPIGLLLHSASIRWAIGQGFVRYDLLRGDESYKYSLGAVDEWVRTVVIYRKQRLVESEFLDPDCKAMSLDMLKRRQDIFPASTVERLYGQLLECWPDEPTVLAQYAQWLGDTGNERAADNISVHLANRRQPS